MDKYFLTPQHDHLVLHAYIMTDKCLNVMGYNQKGGHWVNSIIFTI